MATSLHPRTQAYPPFYIKSAKQPSTSYSIITYPLPLNVLTDFLGTGPVGNSANRPDLGILSVDLLIQEAGIP